MLSVFLFARKWFGCVWVLPIVLLLVAQGMASEGRASLASLLSGVTSPKGLGGFYSSPARFAEGAYGVSYYWMDDVDEISWNLSLDFGSDAYRVGAFVSYQSMDSLYRNSYSEVSFAKTWAHAAVGMSYGLDMEWIPGSDFWARHRFKWGIDYCWRKISVAGLLSGFLDEGVSPTVGVHWDSDDAIAAFAESDFDYLYVGAVFRWKFLDFVTCYRFPDFAVAIQLSVRCGRFGASYARGFHHNSLGWNGVHVSRWIR
jgi:hypothetical protein